MMMAENGIIDSTIADEAMFAKEYIDDLLSNGKLPPKETDYSSYDDSSNDYGGYAYSLTEATKSDFDEIKAHLLNAREKALENAFPKIATGLLDLMKTDSRTFFEQVSATSNGPSPYAVTPVLCHIPAKDFVKAWLESPVNNRKYLTYAMENRYKEHYLANSLNAEKEWLKSVIELVDKKADEARGFEKLRIKSYIPKKLRDIIAVDE